MTSPKSPRFTNRLSNETSPYLLQHAHNPVDWYPWGTEALGRAKKEAKPIFLSIGYSACHWCHVMEHESFEDEETAKILNAHFISIKVDREERQDLDHIYMNAVQVMTQRGGWPMSVFLTPEGEPFYGGTYFPPEDRYGMPSFKKVLLGVAGAWKNRKEEILQTAKQLQSALREMQAPETSPSGQPPLSWDLVALATQAYGNAYDATNGGFGSAPKFFHSGDLRVLLRHWRKTREPSSLEIVTNTLKKISLGGIYDQLGGGFHRYSTDAQWLVPHFEKMLYDNALLATTFLEAYQATRTPLFAKTASETLDYVLREMTSPEGGFYSTQDADSEGVEGKFYVWTKDEITSLIKDDLAEQFCKLYNVTSHGNWEHTNILHLSQTLEDSAKALGLEIGWLDDSVASAKRKLLAARNKRIAPFRDEKILVSWNGLMIEAMVKGYQVLRDGRYLAAAENAADFVLSKMLDARSGRLSHVYKDGAAKLAAYVDDYGALVTALLNLFETTGELRWLKEAQALCKVLMDQFWDATEASFFYTAKDHETLIMRPRETQDGAMPSANGLAIAAIARLGRILGDTTLMANAENALQSQARLMRQGPMAAAQLLITLDFLMETPTETVIFPGADDETENFLNHVWDRFLPSNVLIIGTPSALAAKLPLLQGRAAKEGKTTAYVCEAFTCLSPVDSGDQFSDTLDLLTRPIAKKNP